MLLAKHFIDTLVDFSTVEIAKQEKYIDNKKSFFCPLEPYQVFPVADGHIIIASGNDGQFAKLCAVLGEPELDLSELGFGGVDPEATGRPSYHPSVLLKLYIYGYFNRRIG